MTLDYSDRLILEQSKEMKLKEIVELKKKKVHKLSHRSESTQNRLNKKPS